MENSQLIKEFNPIGEWLIFGMGYSEISLIACEEMIRSAVDGKIKKDFLYIPTIYNIKHAMEIFEKLILLIIDDKDCLGKNDWTHDISGLFIKLENKIDFEKMERHYAKKSGVYYLTEVDAMKKTIAECYDLVEKYYHLLFLVEKIGPDFLIEDKKNTAFRYPENILLIKPKYLKVLEKIKIEDIEEIKKDVAKLIKFWDIGLDIGSYLYDDGYKEKSNKKSNKK